jgi:hypothetical protein
MTAFADRVHNAAALIAGGLISNPDVIELNQVCIAQDAIYLVAAVDAAIAERERANMAESIESVRQVISGYDDAYRAGFLAGEANARAAHDAAVEEAYARGLADGRANPWRPMDEYDGQAAIVAGRPPFGSRTGLAYIRQVPHGYRALPADFGWLPLPTPPAE